MDGRAAGGGCGQLVRYAPHAGARDLCRLASMMSQWVEAVSCHRRACCLDGFRQLVMKGCFIRLLGVTAPARCVRLEPCSAHTQLQRQSAFIL